MTSKVLVIDDDQAMCELIEESLRASGFDVTWRLRAEDALDLLRDADFDVIVADLNLGQMSGIELCKRVMENRPGTPVIIMTGYADMSAAIAAIQAGAFDFITKPVEMEVLNHALRRALSHRRLRNELRRLITAPEAPRSSPRLLLGESPVMRELNALIRRVAPTDTTVLVSGENGTGKEVVAHELHDQSGRAQMPFVAINCAAVPGHLLESELFGHVKGAFTDARENRSGLLEHAAGGTLVLDEIGEMPLDLQPKLLRVLQERQMRPVGGNTLVPVTARIIAITNRDLEGEVAARRFREDLYYRLNVVQLHVPSLQQRGGDVLALAQHFVAKCCERSGKQIQGISSAAAEKLLAYDWPGNVRQLENTIERAIALTQSNQVGLEDLPPRIRDFVVTTLPLTDFDDAIISLDDLEKRHILRTLQIANGNKTKTAQMLGVDRRTLYRKLERYESEGHLDVRKALENMQASEAS